MVWNVATSYYYHQYHIKQKRTRFISLWFHSVKYSTVNLWENPITRVPKSGT